MQELSQREFFTILMCHRVAYTSHTIQLSIMSSNCQRLLACLQAAMQCQNTADSGMARVECRTFSALQFLKKTQLGHRGLALLEELEKNIFFSDVRLKLPNE